MSIQVRIKSVYGSTKVYPVCDKALAFARLVKQITLTETDIATIKALGYTIEVVQDNITL